MKLELSKKVFLTTLINRLEECIYMTKYFLILICCIFVNQSSKCNNLTDENDTSKWINPKVSLKKIFISTNDNKDRHVLKLYEDFTYEFLVYQKYNRSFELIREIGIYEWDGIVLKIYKNGLTKINSAYYLSKYISLDGKSLYKNIISALFEAKKPFLVETKNVIYKLPFYINPDNNSIIRNKDAPKKIDLADLVYEITKNLKSSREKVNQIVDFIRSSISYDYKHIEKSKDTKEILAGKHRLGVCDDYANITKELLNYCSISCDKILGSAKTDLTSVLFEYSINHAWNTINIDNKICLYDVCWMDAIGDEWADVDPKFFILSHFPQNNKDQILEKPISKYEFDHLPFIEQEQKSNLFNFYPKTGINYVKDSFTVIYDTIIKNIEVYSIDSSFFKIAYSFEPKIYKTKYSLKQIRNVKVTYLNGRTSVTIPINHLIQGILVNFNGININYLVVKDSQFKLFKYYVNNYSKFYVDSYLRSILSCIYLNEIEKLKEIVGNTNSTFFDNMGRLILSKYSIDRIKNWDGLISPYQMTTIYINNLDGTRSHSVKYTITACQIEFTINSDNNGYKVTNVFRTN